MQAKRANFIFKMNIFEFLRQNTTLESTSDILIIFCNKVDFLQRFIHISIY